MKKEDKSPSLETLGENIRQLQEKVTQPRSAAGKPSSAVQGGLELVSGALVGAGFGYALDTWLGTLPVFFIMCFFLGAAGGFLTLYRTTQATSTMPENDSNKTDSDQ